MAARVNIRFLLILIVILGAVGGGVGVYFLSQKQTAEQFLAKAQELEDAGNLKAAQRQLEQAISLEPRNEDALNRMEALYGRLIPRSQSEANEFFPKTISVRTHRSIFFGDDVNAQLRAIAACRSAIRYLSAMQSRGWWDAANEAAGRLMRMDDADAQAAGKTMRGLWLASADGGVTLRADRSESDRDEGRLILRELVADRPMDDGARAALIAVLRSNLEVLQQSEARESELEEADADLILALEDAAEALNPDAVEDGSLPPVRTWTAIVNGWRAIGARRDDGIRAAKAEAFGVEEARDSYDVALARLRTAGLTLRTVAQDWAESAPVDADGDYLRILSEAADMISILSPESSDYSTSDIFDEALGRDGIGSSILARFLSLRARASDARRGGGDAAERGAAIDAMRAAAAEVLAAGPQNAGLDALISRRLWRRAHGLAVEAELLAFEVKPEAEQAVILVQMQAAKTGLDAYLEELGIDPSEASDSLYTAGLIRYAEGDNTATASLLERVLRRESAGLDRFQQSVAVRILAQSLEREGALPRAARFYERALESVPNDPRSLTELIKIKIRLSDYGNATELVERLEQLSGDDPSRAMLVEGLRRTIAISRGDVSDDPTAMALAEIRELEDAGRFDEALTKAEELVASQPAGTIAGVHARVGELAVRAGNQERAQAAFARAVELEPGNPAFVARLASVATDDPIQRSIGMAEASVSDPAERAARLADLFATEIRVLRRQLDATDQPEEQARLEAEITRFEAALAVQESAAREAFAQGGSSTAVSVWMTRLVQQAAESDDWSEAEAFLVNVQQNDLDRAGGSLAEGQIMMARGESSDGDERVAYFEQAAAAFSDALEFLPFSESVARLLGVTQRRLGRTEAAVRSYARALENAPGNSTIAREYCQTLVNAGQRTLALQVATNSVARNPNDRSLREFWLGLELDAGNAGLVLLERRRVYAGSPGDRNNAIRYAYLLLDTQPTYALLVGADGRALMNPGEWNRMGSSRQQARLDAERRTWIDEARGIVADVANAMGDEPEVELGLEILRAIAAEVAGDGDGAAGIVREMVASDDGDVVRPAVVAAAAGLFVRFNRVQDAIDLLAAEQERLGAPDAAIQWSLAQIIREAGRPDLAAGPLQAARGASGGEPFTVYIPRFANLMVSDVQVFPVAVDRGLAQAMLQAGAVADARALWDESRPHEAREDRFVELAIIAREADRARRGDDAAAAAERESTFQSLLAELREEDPTDPQTWGLEIQRLVLRSRLEGRVELLDEAMQVLADGRTSVLDPSRLEVATLLVLETRGNFEGLASELETIVEARPGDDARRGRLVEAYLTLDRPSEAERVIRGGVDLYGLSDRAIPWLIQLGGLQSSQDEHVEAAETFGVALAITNGQDLTILRRQVRELLSGGAPASRRVADMLARMEAEMIRDPGLRAVFGRSLLLLGRNAPGEQQFAQSLADMQTEIDSGAMRPSDTALWVRELVGGVNQDVPEAEARVRRLTNDQPDPWMLLSLAQAYAGEGPGGMSRGIVLVEEAIAATPSGPEAAALRAIAGKTYGGFLVQAGRPDEALAAFEQALQDAPRDAELLNNAAFLQATVLGDPGSALPKALAAVNRMPDNWAFLDTAGKICGLLERWDDAESYLRRSIAAQERATNIFHLAEILAATDRRAEALRQLERASELLDPTDTDLRDQINQLADQLSGG